MQKGRGMILEFSQVSQTIYKNTERLLDLYRKVQFRVKQNLSEIDTELYIEDRKHLADLLHEIIDFDMTAEKKRIQDRVKVAQRLAQLGIEGSIDAWDDFNNNKE